MEAYEGRREKDKERTRGEKGQHHGRANKSAQDHPSKNNLKYSQLRIRAPWNHFSTNRNAVLYCEKKCAWIHISEHRFTADTFFFLARAYVGHTLVPLARSAGCLCKIEHEKRRKLSFSAWGQNEREILRFSCQQCLDLRKAAKRELIPRVGKQIFFFKQQFIFSYLTNSQLHTAAYRIIV